MNNSFQRRSTGQPGAKVLDRAGLKNRAIRLLARREHSRAEMFSKLAAVGEAEEVASVVQDLEATGLLSDARFAESYLRTYGERFGAAKLRQNLRSKGLDKELVDNHLAEAELADEAERAKALWERKFGSAPADSREWGKQARFLQSRGFSSSIISRLLKHLDE